jgi:hypothetical protein
MQKCVCFEVHTSFLPETMKGRHHQMYLVIYWGLALILGLALQKLTEGVVDRIKVVHDRSPNRLLQIQQITFWFAKGRISLFQLNDYQS